LRISYAASNPLAFYITRGYTCAVNKPRESTYIWLTFIILIAFLLRLYQLDQRALWFDEGVTLTFGTLPLSKVLAFHILWEDTNPPVYRVLVGGWSRLVGISAFTARYFSVWLGTIGVALVYHVGRRLHVGRTAAIVGGMLMAAAPIQIYYSREAKGYTFVQALILLLVVVWLILFRAPTTDRGAKLSGPFLALAGVVIFAATALAFGAHYISGLFFVTSALWTIGHLIRNARTPDSAPAPWTHYAIWFGGQLAAGLVWLPWILPTIGSAAQGTRAAAVGYSTVTLSAAHIIDYVLSSFAEFASGPVGPPWMRITLTLLFTGLALAGSFSHQLRSRARWLLASWLLVPLVLGFPVKMAITFFWPRFLLFVVPALALLAGCGWAAIQQTLQSRSGSTWLPITAPSGAGLILICGLLVAQYQRPDPQPDLRPLADDLARQITPAEAVLYSYSWQPGMLSAYLPADRQPTYYATFFPSGTLSESLQAILDQHKRVWLLTYRISADSPDNDVGLWLLENAATPGGTWYGESQFSLFLHPSTVVNPGSPTSCKTFADGAIELCFAPVDPSATARPGGPVSLAVTWRADSTPDIPYTVFVHLIESGQPAPVAQQDGQPVNGLKPTTAWLPGQEVLDRHAVILPTELEGDQLDIVVGLYDPSTLERLPVDGGGDSVLIGHLSVESAGPPPASP
jgi:mannosyltransferase